MTTEERVNRLEEAFADLIDLHRKDSEILGRISESLSLLADAVVQLEVRTSAVETGLADLRSELVDTRTAIFGKLESVEFDVAIIKGVVSPDDGKETE